MQGAVVAAMSACRTCHPLNTCCALMFVSPCCRAGVELWQKEGVALLPADNGGHDMVAVHRQLYLMHFLVDGLGEWTSRCCPLC